MKKPDISKRDSQSRLFFYITSQAACVKIQINIVFFYFSWELPFVFFLFRNQGKISPLKFRT